MAHLISGALNGVGVDLDKGFELAAFADETPELNGVTVRSIDSDRTGTALCHFEERRFANGNVERMLVLNRTALEQNGWIIAEG